MNKTSFQYNNQTNICKTQQTLQQKHQQMQLHINNIKTQRNNNQTNIYQPQQTHQQPYNIIYLLFYH
uniref:Uncharacterized protein n=1 Tax=Meloidogyne enterolobii TaxID=390850 RepID=A0A6V7TVC6_MELEN|nr:unnamed protein product [Meloidogyne enterolobii]